MVRKFWCWVCNEYRNHTMQPNSERGICVVCQSVNWAPMGDID